MADGLKPSEELTVGALAATCVYSIFQLNVGASFGDIHADKPGNANTYNSTKAAAWTATAVVSGLALLSKSPTVLVIGGAMILGETWKTHIANFTQSGSQD